MAMEDRPARCIEQFEHRSIHAIDTLRLRGHRRRGDVHSVRSDLERSNGHASLDVEFDGECLTWTLDLNARHRREDLDGRGCDPGILHECIAGHESEAEEGHQPPHESSPSTAESEGRCPRRALLVRTTANWTMSN